MSESIRAQLEKLWCKDDEVEEPIMKPTEPPFNASNAVNPISDGFICNLSLKRE